MRVNIFNIFCMSNIKKLLICGSREFSDYDYFSSRLDEYLSSADLSKIEIVSGGARGTDTLAEMYAEHRNIKFTKFSTDWQQYGHAASYVRNGEMAKYCRGPMNTTIAFWDGKSLGTKHMMREALRERMTVVKFIVNR